MLFFEIKLTESIGNPKDILKGLKSLWLPNQIILSEVEDLKINNTIEHDDNSVLKGFKKYFSALVEKLVKMQPKPPNKYSTSSIIKYYEHMIHGDPFNLASILTILKTTQVSKAAGPGNLSERFLMDGAKLLSKPSS